MDNDLPFIDQHQVLVAAPAPAVWRSLATQMTGLRRAGTQVFAHVLATEPRRAAGESLGEGATMPGFEVVQAAPGHRVRLMGRHRFSRYALTFTLVEKPDGTLLSARTDAEFPGLRGGAYRRLVIGSGAHRVVVARMLRAVRHRAEDQKSDEIC